MAQDYTKREQALVEPQSSEDSHVLLTRADIEALLAEAITVRTALDHAIDLLVMIARRATAHQL